MQRIYQLLSIQVQQAIEVTFREEILATNISKNLLNPQIMPASKPEFGDFQVNGALSLAKLIKKSPREIANNIVNQLNKNSKFKEVCLPPVIAGPGFINITLKEEYLITEIIHRAQDEKLGVPILQEESSKSNRVIVDFSSPNIAKEMHVGHLRSTIIGDSIARILEFRGYSVLRLNHVGDWGTQFGMLITHLKNVAPEALTTANKVDLGDLVAFYRQAKQCFDIDKNFKSSSRQEVVKLQQGNEKSIKAWNLLCSQSRKEFQKIYDLLDIKLEERGESFYNPFLESVVTDLNKLGLLVTDQGAQCVFLEGITGKDNNPLPVIIKKSDGGFNYSTTDLAAIRYRLSPPPKGDGACRVIYVTDAGQANHFLGVFQVAKRAKWIPNNCHVEHVPFGLVQGEDGKKLKTRSGETVRLIDLLTEAINRAKQDLINRLEKEGRQESIGFVEEVSKVVGLAAVKYADLSQNRITNYQFSFDRMLSLQGNTAPYLLYALVRIAGINRKSKDLLKKQMQVRFHEKEEWSLIRQLLKFEDVIIQVEEELLPNRLCNYLFELSQVFNRFYDHVPVLKAEEPFQSSRLILCQMTGSTLKLGLNLLGIATLERM